MFNNTEKRLICQSQLNYIIFIFGSYKRGSSGEILDHFPSTIAELASIEVDYVTLPGWQSSTENIRNFKELPENAQRYIRFMESELSVPVRWVGVGKGRESIINIV